MSESRRLRRERVTQDPASGATTAPESVAASSDAAQHPSSVTITGDPGAWRADPDAAAAREIAVPDPAPTRYPRAGQSPDPELHGGAPPSANTYSRAAPPAAPAQQSVAGVTHAPAGHEPQPAAAHYPAGNIPQPAASQPATGFAPDATRSARPQHATAAKPTLGAEPGQTKLRSGSTKPPLGRGGWPLPELTARQEKPRPWWLHPAFIVSIVLTFLALAGMVTWAILAAIFSTDVVVTDLKITIEGGNAQLDWSGPDAEYSLYALGGSEPVDLTGFVRGTGAWLPSAVGAYDSDTCFVVRSAEFTGEVSLSADALAAENAQSVCVSDAGQ